MPEEFLFVSHVSEDRDAAMQVVEELERRGLHCWIAPRNVRPGRPFDDEIANAIETCQAMLLIFSERCNDSEYIRREVTVAGESHKVVIPFRIENVEPKRGLRVRLSDLHWLDGFASREKAIDELIGIFPGLNEPREKAILEAAGRRAEGVKLRQPQRFQARSPWQPSLLIVGGDDCSLFDSGGDRDIGLSVDCDSSCGPKQRASGTDRRQLRRSWDQLERHDLPGHCRHHERGRRALQLPLADRKQHL